MSVLGKISSFIFGEGHSLQTIDLSSAFEGNRHLEWFAGNYSDYLIDYKRRYGESAEIPSRIKYKKFSR